MSVENGIPTSSRRGAMPPGGATTFDLFSWSEGPDLTRGSPPVPVRHSNAFPSSSSSSADQTTCNNGSPVGRPAVRMQQPAGGISTITFGEQLSAEEADALLKRRPGSDLKKREMYGSGIFPAGDDGDGTAAMDNTGVRCCHQPAGGVSQISFGGGEDCVSPKKAVTVPEVAKQKELSGTVETTDDLAYRRVFSNAKAKELVGSNIFGPQTPDSSPRSSSRALEFRREVEAKAPAADEAAPPPRNVHTSVKVSNPAGGRCQISFGPIDDESDSAARKLHDQKKAELSGHDIFSEENALASSEKNLSQAKLKELSGSDIFSDDKPAGRDFIGGIRKPPGGGSTISLQ
ncbi:unnamed protein product [Sphagnum compactum]